MATAPITLTTGDPNWNPHIYTCDVCGHQGFWRESWSWYGSLKDAEDGNWSKVSFFVLTTALKSINKRRANNGIQPSI